MNIALIGQKGTPSAFGGIERHVEELSVRLVTQGHSITVYNRSWYAKKRKQYKGVRVVTVPSIHTKHLDAITHSFFSTMHALLFTKTEIFHYQNTGPTLVAWIPRILKPSARVITTFHSIDRKHKKWGALAKTWLRLSEWTACTFSHKVIVVSHVMQRYLRESYDCNAAYVPNGLEEPEIITTDKRINKKFNLKKDGYILVVTRLIRHKGVHHLIKAFKQIKTTKKLAIVGEGSFSDDYVDELKKLAHNDNRIVFTGFQSGVMLSELYSNAYIVVQPSEYEGLSFSLIEAMNYQKPILASDIEQNKEPLGENGWYFKSGNSIDLKRELQKLLKTPKSRLAQKAQKAQLFIRNEFNWSKAVRLTEHVYESTLEDKPLSLVAYGKHHNIH